MVLRAFLPVIIASLLAAGCGKKDAASSGQTAKGPSAQILHIGNGAEPQDIDPQAITGVPEHAITQALFEGLAGEDPKDLHPIPALAESWDISTDGLIYTFRLRADIKWSNGDPITSDDFVQSYKRMLSPAFASEYAYLIFNFVKGAHEYYKGELKDFSQVGFATPDPRTLVVTLKNATPYLMKIIASHTAWTPVPMKEIARHGPVDQKRTAWTRPENLVTSGPFVMKQWLPNQKIVVARNPLHWDAKTVKLDEIHFYPTEDISSEERMFRTGQLHITHELPNAKIDTYRKEYPDSLRIEPWLGLYFFRCNVTRAPLNDKRVRQAIALAIDRESLIKNVVRGGEEPAYAVSYPGTAGYAPRARLEGTVADAKRLLAEAGYPDGKGCLPIDLLFNTSEKHRAIGEAVQAMLKKNLGIEVRLLNQEWKVYLETQHSTHDFMLQRSGWIADYVDPHVFLEIWATGGGNNDTLWGNPEYDRLLQQALATADEKSRYEIYQKMDAILVDELPVIPVYHYKRVHAVSPKVKGYYPTLLDHHPYKHIWLEE